MKQIVSMLLVSLLFAICHGQINIPLIPIFILGMLYTAIYELYPSIMISVFWDLIILI